MKDYIAKSYESVRYRHVYNLIHYSDFANRFHNGGRVILIGSTFSLSNSLYDVQPIFQQKLQAADQEGDTSHNGVSERGTKAYHKKPNSKLGGHSAEPILFLAEIEKVYSTNGSNNQKKIPDDPAKVGSGKRIDHRSGDLA